MKAICDQCGKEYDSGKHTFQNLFGYCLIPDENTCDECYLASRIHSLIRCGLIDEYKPSQTGF